jgi:hypothetical protein
MTTRWIAVWLIVVAAAARPASAQPDAGSAGPVYVDPADLVGAPEISAAASPAEVQLGRTLTLLVTAVFEEGVTPVLGTDLGLAPAFEETRRTPPDRARSDGLRIREWQVELIAWELGELTIPGIAVSYILGGTPYSSQTNAVPIRVFGTLGDLVDTAEPQPHAPPVSLWRDRAIVFWLIVLAVALHLLITLVVIARTDQRGPARIAATVVPPRISGMFRRPRLGGPAEEALARLEAIDSSGMLARDRKIAYTEMVDVMQSFLGRQLGGDVTDLTTGELRDWLAGVALASGTRLELSRWLDECDLVEFGGYRASIDEGRDQLAIARELVISIAAPAGAGGGDAPPAAGAGEEVARA